MAVYFLLPRRKITVLPVWPKSVEGHPHYQVFNAGTAVSKVQSTYD
jgi:hypothetical protein